MLNFDYKRKDKRTREHKVGLESIKSLKSKYKKVQGSTRKYKKYKKL